MLLKVIQILLVRNTALLSWVLYYIISYGIKYESYDLMTNDHVLKSDLRSDDGGRILAQISSPVAW